MIHLGQMEPGQAMLPQCEQMYEEFWTISVFVLWYRYNPFVSYRSWLLSKGTILVRKSVSKRNMIRPRWFTLLLIWIIDASNQHGSATVRAQKLWVRRHSLFQCMQAIFCAFHLKISQSELIVLSVGPYDEIARYNLFALWALILFNSVHWLILSKTNS